MVEVSLFMVFLNSFVLTTIPRFQLITSFHVFMAIRIMLFFILDEAMLLKVLILAELYIINLLSFCRRNLKVVRRKRYSQAINEF